MDISAVVVVIILSALFLGAIIWMEIRSRKNRSKGLTGKGRISYARKSRVNKKARDHF